MIFLLSVLASASSLAASFSPLDFSSLESVPPFSFPLLESEAKEVDIEKVAKALELDKSWPFAEKDISFEKGFDFSVGKTELEKEFSKIGLEKSVGWEKSPYPWYLYEKIFGLGKKISFEQALLYELYRLYGYYGLFVARELQRRFQIAKELGLVGKEIAFQEAISLGLFKGIGLEKIFESVRKIIGAEEKTFDFEKGFGIFKKL
ncbi:uncharacterized protein [Parasteatoda tepidariorum]|uniref:uncharacterized protein n=1 Tax=Parasteatoda tepidariorum TaxID=114398 RepID=UPI00077F88F8|nr:uncharacterized protein LOC107449358 [Parasteatoda tepidariorum]